MAKFLLINPNSNCILVINQLKLSLIIASRLLVLKNSLHFFCYPYKETVLKLKIGYNRFNKSGIFSVKGKSSSKGLTNISLQHPFPKFIPVKSGLSEALFEMCVKREIWIFILRY
ncbi:MAG: hypothetical protein A2066_05615 [Bacteroidetes bacterium GWB2_41_8]|nr:MAG: hypothetical protein A2066_05615 [Bacteroidetes bacterium GWB2_41_8]